ncbi:MAG: hypothetical protein ACR2P0_08000 [Acidimicrobiales bacterium]
MSTSPAAVDAAFDRVAERRASEAEHAEAKRVLWRTHHWPHRYDRCMTIGGRPVCRRCFWFYSISFAVAALGFAGISPWPASWDQTLVWALSIPATVEFVGGEIGWWRYDARRQTIVTAILAPAVGRGMYAELQDQGSWLFWGPVLVFGSTWFIAAVIGWLRKSGQYSP